MGNLCCGVDVGLIRPRKLDVRSPICTELSPNDLYFASSPIAAQSAATLPASHGAKSSASSTPPWQRPWSTEPKPDSASSGKPTCDRQPPTIGHDLRPQRSNRLAIARERYLNHILYRARG